MARKATKDTYAVENVGGEEVRRQVFADTMVPDHYEVEDDSAIEGDPVDAGRSISAAAAEHADKVTEEARKSQEETDRQLHAQNTEGARKARAAQQKAGSEGQKK